MLSCKKVIRIDADGSSISSLTGSDSETEKEPTMNVEADEESINEDDDSNERTQVLKKVLAQALTQVMW
jgi:hypothetical protein